MITLHGLVVLTLTMVISVIACGLALAAGSNWPTALLTAGAAAGGALALLPKLIDNRSDR